MIVEQCRHQLQQMISRARYALQVAHSLRTVYILAEQVEGAVAHEAIVGMVEHRLHAHAALQAVEGVGAGALEPRVGGP